MDSSPRHQRLTDIYLEACDLQGEDRIAYLDQACGDDLSLREEVESMLATHSDSGEDFDGLLEGAAYAHAWREGDVVVVDNLAVAHRAAKEREIPKFKGSYLGRFPLVSADFWTSDHLSERSRRVGAFSGTRARGTLTLKRR